MRLSIKYLIGCSLLLVLGLALVISGSFFLFQFSDDTKPRVFQAYLYDPDGDGDLDAFVVYLNEVNRILHNDGTGRFTFAEGLMMHSYAMALADIDGDGTLEAILNNFDGQSTDLLCAETPFGFTLNTLPVNGSGPALATHDGDADGAPEAYLAGCCNGVTTIFNYETFSNPTPCLGQERTNAVDLVDLNADGVPDAFLAKGRIYNHNDLVGSKTPNEVWFNDDDGNFSDSGQRLGQAESLVVVAGDLNGDGSPDVVVGNRGPDEVWINDGYGNFRSNGQRLGKGPTHALFLADLDNDGDPDLFTAGETTGQVWLNDGAGRFGAGQRLAYGRDVAIALGDLTGDGAIDAFAAGVELYRIWHGAGDGSFTSGQPVEYEDGGMDKPNR